MVVNKPTVGSFNWSEDYYGLVDRVNALDGIEANVAGKQAADSDLTAIAALDSTTAGALATDGSGWVRKTYTQLKTALGLAKGDIGLGAVDNTSDAAKPVSTAQQTALDAKVAKSTQVVDAADYGLATGGTAAANLTALDAAVAAIPATGGRLLIRPGTYSINPWVVSSKHGLVIDGPGAVLSCATGAPVTVQGTRTTAATTVTANIAADADTITVASGTGLAAGDLIVLRSSGEVFDPERPSQYLKGELAWIASVSGTTVTLESRTYDSYTTTGNTISVDKLTPIRDVAVRGLSIIGGGTGQIQAGIQALHFTNFTVDSCTVDLCERQAIVARIGWGATLTNNRVSRANEDGLGYGVRAIGVHHAHIAGNRGRRNRHTTDVDFEVVPTRHFDMVNNHAEDDLSAGISTHGGAAHGTVTGNHTDHCGGGLVVRSATTYIGHNVVRGTKTGAETGGQSYGHGIVLGDDSPNTPGVGVVGRGLRVVDNQIDITHGSLGGATTYGIYATASLRDAQIRGNRLRGFSSHGMWFKGDTAVAVRITDNDVDCTSQVGTAGTTLAHGILIAAGNDSVSGNNQQDVKVTRNRVASPLYSAVRVVGNVDNAAPSDGLEVTDNTLRSYGLRGVDVGTGYFARGVIDRNVYDETAVNRLVYTVANWAINPDQTVRDSTGLLATGEETLPRILATSSGQAVPASGTVWFTFFTARKTEITTQIRLSGGAAAAGATPTVARVGLYEVNLDGSLTLRASTANDTTLLNASFAAPVRSWSASYAKIAGKRYAVGIIVVSAAAMPSLYGNAGSSSDWGREPMLCSQFAGQTDLPSSVAAGSLSTSGPGKVFSAAVLP